MEEGRKFNTDCPTNNLSSIIHYRIKNLEGVFRIFFVLRKNLNKNLVIYKLNRIFALENNINPNNMNTATTNASPNTFVLTMPKADVSFFKTMVKKMGWTIERKRTAKPRLYDPETGDCLNDKTMKVIENVRSGKEPVYEMKSMEEFKAWCESL